MPQAVKTALLALSVLAASSAQAQVVKCVDAKGRVEYAKVCPLGSTEAARIRRDETPPPAAPAPPVRATPALAGNANAGEIGPAQLDNAEDNVCMAARNSDRARAAQAQKGSLPVERVAGPIDDPRRRESLQQKMDASTQSSQDSLVASFTKDLARYQAEYRRLTGSEFNTSLCDDTQRRTKRREAWEMKRRDELLQKHADQAMSNEPEGIRAICQQKEAMDGPSKDRAVGFTAEQVKDIQERGRAGYARLVASYERSYNKTFDPRRCP